MTVLGSIRVSRHGRGWHHKLAVGFGWQAHCGAGVGQLLQQALVMATRVDHGAKPQWLGTILPVAKSAEVQLCVASGEALVTLLAAYRLSVAMIRR